MDRTRTAIQIDLRRRNAAWYTARSVNGTAPTPEIAADHHTEHHRLRVTDHSADRVQHLNARLTRGMRLHPQHEASLSHKLPMERLILNRHRKQNGSRLSRMKPVRQG